MDTRRLTLLRHGQAQPVDGCPDDFERALTRHGNAEAHEIAARMVQKNLVPDLVLVSPAERAWATAAIVAAACELEARQLQAARELYLATPETMWRLLKQLDARVGHVLICGHNPGLSQIAGRLGPHPQARDLPTAGLVTACWRSAVWTTLEPETAAECEWDAPENPENTADLWT